MIVLKFMYTNRNRFEASFVKVIVLFTYWNQSVQQSILIDLVTVFDAILTSRQTHEKLQCLYENLMSNNFRGTAVLKKIWFVN